MTAWADVRHQLAAVHQLRSGAVVIEFTDGRVAAHPALSNGFPDASRLSSTTVRPNENRMILTTTAEDQIIVELPSEGDVSPLSGRPTIYLDQKDWSTLANTRFAPERVRDDLERQAARSLIRLAEERKVILPMSAGHLQETTQWLDSERRYRLGLTVAQLSAGWQLRDPLDVRRRELVDSLVRQYRRATSPPTNAVTLEPNAWHSSHEASPSANTRDLPAQAMFDIRAVSGMQAMIDVLLDAEPTPSGDVPGWAPQFEQFAAFLAADPRGPELKRRRTHAKFIADLGRELPQAAWHASLTAEQMSDWTLNRSEGALKSMPALGLYRELLHEKLSNPGRRWVQNDLTDMMYLTTAAGYCDHVVGERAHISDLAKAARRLDRNVSLHPNLASLRECL